MDLSRLAMLFMLSSACSSVPVKINTVQNSRAFLTPQKRVLQKCLTTCLEGKQSQVCFDKDISDARPAPVLPDYICKSIGCRKPIDTCPTGVTTFPFQCMLQGSSGLIQSDVDGVESICNVPVQRMKPCSFNPTLAGGTSADFSHGQEVTFETQQRNSTKRRSKKCVCYNGQWMRRKAVDGTSVMTKNRFICDVHNSNNLKYLRVKKVMEPVFPKKGVFEQKCLEVENRHVRLWFMPCICSLQDFFFFWGGGVGLPFV